MIRNTLHAFAAAVRAFVAHGHVDGSLSRESCEPPVILLIGGGPRTGTTLLVDLLNENPRVGILSEYVFDSFVRLLDPLLDRERLVERLSLPPVADPTEELEVCASSYELRENSRLRFPKRFPLRDDFARLLRTVIATALGKEAVRVIGAKDPFFTLHHDRAYLDEQVGLPVRYLLVLRNPITQINSSLNRRNLTKDGRDRWHIQSVHDAIHEYRSMCILNYSYLMHFQQEALLVKHEDLVVDPHRTLHHIYDLVGLQGDVELGRVEVAEVSYPVSDEEETRLILEAFGTANRNWATREVTAARDPAAPFCGLLELYPRPFTLVLRPEVPGRPLLGLGWYHAFEPEGARSKGADAYLVFAVAEDGETSINLTLGPVFTDNLDRMECAIFVDGEHVSTVRWHRDPSAPESLDLQSSGKAPHFAFAGAQLQTIEIARRSLSADMPHAIRLSLSPFGQVLLRQFTLN